ncbi:hypothetical protein T01_6059 [Trichinella spiralis]|uniref:Uncharacterized protein n=1 Tax=Trichinella spiralis TaxID=6334 RepID=A0A0V0Z2Z4_TRISP|nr:hypothetical protein T01_6059 [Trichinella spiralis]
MRFLFISLTTLKLCCSQAGYYQFILMSLVIFAFCACLRSTRRLMIFRQASHSRVNSTKRLT